MHNLTLQLKTMSYRNRDGSFQTQHDRRAILLLIGNQLHALGYRDLSPYQLRGRHVNALMRYWQEHHLSHATIRNRLSVFRWLAEKIGNPGLLSKMNAPYGLDKRRTVAEVSKAVSLPQAILERVKDPYIRFSLALQEQFGLRRQESIKIRVGQADQGMLLVLQASWTKGGRARAIPIRTEEQRALLETIKSWLPTKASSLIPAQLQYVVQERRYEYWTARVGLSKMHGLRHAYAQRRFEELAGFKAPVAGGPAYKDLTMQQREVDEDARAIISTELGHDRLEIVKTYIG